LFPKAIYQNFPYVSTSSSYSEILVILEGTLFWYAVSICGSKLFASYAIIM